ncbi:DMT family transporter [Neisseria leonii]|uniref:DMT family transporter n=1 Tax=Neisseria leonii TaxID=2995413 RepID=UPI00237A9862|nr:DMT family transporter [Neisseria sp. 3986]MDD9326338.1 DMT family transporter [Neisseria sp. 3986]
MMLTANRHTALSALFVLIWSSGFIVGRLIVGTVSPNIFLGIRFALSAVMFGVLASVLRQTYPPVRAWGRHFMVGLLSNGLYLGGSYWAIGEGLPAALMALLGGLQPLLTLVIGVLLLGERTDGRALAGIIVGLGGLYLAVSPSLGLTGVSFGVLAVAFLSVLGITAGLLLQKHWLGKADLLPSLALQNAAGAATAVILARLLGENLLIVNFTFTLGVFWAVCILSGLGLYLFIRLMQGSGSVQTAALVLLAPPLAAVQAWLLFGETLTIVQMAGFVLALVGVWWCRRG